MVSAVCEYMGRNGRSRHLFSRFFGWRVGAYGRSLVMGFRHFLARGSAVLLEA